MESLSNHMSSLGTLTFAKSLSCLFRTCVSIALLFTQMWLTIFVIQVFSINCIGSTVTMSSSKPLDSGRLVGYPSPQRFGFRPATPVVPLDALQHRLPTHPV